MSLHFVLSLSFLFFFFNDTATTEIYTLSLHDALPILHDAVFGDHARRDDRLLVVPRRPPRADRSEEHTSELQSRGHLVCRLLLEKKKRQQRIMMHLRDATMPARVPNERVIDTDDQPIV